MTNPHQPTKHEGQRRSAWWLAAIVVTAGAENCQRLQASFDLVATHRRRPTMAA